MAFVTQRYIQSFLGRRYRDHGPHLRALPECVVLPVRAGHRPSGAPPVRIFVGTETAQFRAERIFIWSIEQVRDPARVYEIYLMKDLAGFHRQLWLTGFTNYRFAIPHLAGLQGRAIYNDVDQIYLADPGALFDLDMDHYGYMSISDQDTSVMLIDCARMATVWPLDDAQCRPRRVLDGHARAVPDLWGPIDPGWNARDAEYVPGETGVLHFTALQTQPWRPLPREYVYAHNPVGHVWLDLERAADAAGFTVFTARQPSAAFRALATRLAALRGTNQPAAPAPRWSRTGLRRLRAAFDKHDIQDILHISLLGDVAPPLRGSIPIRSLDPFDAYTADDGADAVLCTGTLELLPDDDVPWMLDGLFARAGSLIALKIQDRDGRIRLSDGGGFPRMARGAEWWRAQIEAASARRPDIHWIARIDTAAAFGRSRPLWLEGGTRLVGTPVIWVLASDKNGHTSQAVGIAQALGWSYTIKRIEAGPAALLSLIGLGRLPSGRKASDRLAPPWPDLVIASGWFPTRIARRLREQSGGRANVVLLGRKAGALHDGSDIVVSCLHFGLPPHPRRIETVLPPCQISPERLRDAAARWLYLLDNSPAPRVVLLIGGATKAHSFEPDFVQRLAHSVSTAVDNAGGSLFVITSPRTGAAAAKALRQTLPHWARLHVWHREAAENPFLGYLAQGDVFVVTGESESMLAEAVATDRPVYIYPVPQRAPGPWQRLSAWIARRGRVRAGNYRGTVRPQQGLEYLCARLVDRGLVLPPRDLDDLHRRLVALGVARMFQGDVMPFERPFLDPTQDIAARIRALLGVRPIAAAVDANNTDDADFIDPGPDAVAG